MSEVVGLSMRERHELAACWNDEDGNHVNAKWDRVLPTVERILTDRLAAMRAERDEALNHVPCRRALAERDTARREADDLRVRMGVTWDDFCAFVAKHSALLHTMARDPRDSSFEDDWLKVCADLGAALANPSATEEEL